MGENSNIAWTDHTFNPWVGCTKVSPGCKNCYAETWANRTGRDVWGPRGTRERTSPSNWRKPLQWNARAAQEGVRYRVFCASLADVFEDGRPALRSWRLELFNLIRDTPHLDWLLLTKRPENLMLYLPLAWLEHPLPHVWLGTSVEDVDHSGRIETLTNVPAAVRFVSYEPALGPLFDDCTNADAAHILRGIDWLIYGGESGPGRRPDEDRWAVQAQTACRVSGTAFFFKQRSAQRPDQGTMPDGTQPRAFPR